VTRLLTLVGVAVKRQFLDWSGSWWFTLTLLAGQAVGPLVGLFVWSTAVPGEPRLAAYFTALLAVQLLTASYENHTFSESIYQGTVSHELLRPQPVVVRPIGENLAIRAWLTLFGLPLVVLTGVAFGVSYRWPDLLLALPALACAAVLRFLFTWTLALTAFWTERVHAVVSFGQVLIVLLGGSAAPVGLLPEPWQTVAAALPFYPMLGLPADLATGATGTADGAAAAGAFARALAWTAGTGVLAVAVWRAGIRRYTAVGA
jgi:ABC-2 type transport system permease protein